MICPDLKSCWWGRYRTITASRWWWDVDARNQNKRALRAERRWGAMWDRRPRSLLTSAAELRFVTYLCRRFQSSLIFLGAQRDFSNSLPSRLSHPCALSSSVNKLSTDCFTRNLAGPVPTNDSHYKSYTIIDQLNQRYNTNKTRRRRKVMNKKRKKEARRKH